MTTPAKYNSYEEILSEADDKFTKTLETAEGEEKTLMEKARDARRAGVEAGETWQKEFEAFKAEKAPNLEEGHELLNKKAEKEALIKTLEADSGKVVETVTNGTKEVTTTVQSALNKKAKSYYNAVSKLESLISQGATKAEIDAQRQAVLNIEKDLNKFCENIAEKLEYKGNDKQISKAKERVTEKFKNYINERKEYLTRHNATAGTPIEVSNYLKDLKLQANSKQELTKALSSLTEATGKDMQALYNANESNALKLIERHSTLESKKLKTLLNMQAGFEEAVAKNGAETISVKVDMRKALKEGLKSFVKGGDATLLTIVKEGGFNSIEEFVASLTEKDKQLLLNGEVTKETIDNAVKASQDRVKLLESAPENLKNLSNEVRYGRNFIEADMKAIRAKYGEKAFVNKEGVLYVHDGKKAVPYKPNKNNIAEPKLGNMPKAATMPKGNITIEVPNVQTVEKAAGGVESEALRAARQELAVIDEQILAERLQKAAVTDEKALMEEFAKTGKGTKEEAIKKAQNGFKNDVKKLFEGKRGGKFWATVTGTAIVGALLFSALRPSGKEA